jgi:hypothetical protein
MNCIITHVYISKEGLIIIYTNYGTINFVYFHSYYFPTLYVIEWYAKAEV